MRCIATVVFMKNIQEIKKYYRHWRSQKFQLEGGQIGKNLWHYFREVFRWLNSDDITEMTS